MEGHTPHPLPMHIVASVGASLQYFKLHATLFFLQFLCNLFPDNCSPLNEGAFQDFKSLFNSILGWERPHGSVIQKWHMVPLKRIFQTLLLDSNTINRGSHSY